MFLLLLLLGTCTNALSSHGNENLEILYLLTTYIMGTQKVLFVGERCTLKTLANYVLNF